MKRGPENSTALEGSDVTVYCECDGSPIPNVTWYKNGELVDQRALSFMSLFVI